MLTMVFVCGEFVVIMNIKGYGKAQPPRMSFCVNVRWEIHMTLMQLLPVRKHIAGNSQDQSCAHNMGKKNILVNWLPKFSTARVFSYSYGITFSIF